MAKNNDYYIGLMAGTSLDGIDACIINHDNQIIATHYLPYPDITKQQIINIINNDINLATIADLDIELGRLFAKATNELIAKENIPKTNIIAIGSHGQTIYHAPQKYSWQLANANIIAQRTNIVVVANFRMADITAGGQGAPLTPLYHQQILGDNDGIIVNLGGIANITLVNNGVISGFDTGPANCLLDAWIYKHNGKKYDKDGAFAKTGSVDKKLLNSLLTDKYFAKKPPKSTGFEYFNLQWLNNYLSGNEQAVDVQATLVELSAKTICDNLIANKNVYLCGGGIHNKTLVTKIVNFATNNKVTTTTKLGVHPDYLEAAAFAFFAKQTINKKPSNIPNATGAQNLQILGGIYQNIL